MILWTIKPMAVYEEIQTTGVYHCDFRKSFMRDWQEEYDWLIGQMRSRLGEPPEGISYPVWAWYLQDGQRKKPDLRKERWGNGWKGDRFACMEIEIPDEEVLLSDFDSWSVILLHGLLADTEAEYEQIKGQYLRLSKAERRAYRDRNWERVFDLTPAENDWMRRGATVQATFWELKKEAIRKVWFFTSALPKPADREEGNNA